MEAICIIQICFVFWKIFSQPEFDNSTFDDNMLMYDNDVIIDSVFERFNLLEVEDTYCRDQNLGGPRLTKFTPVSGMYRDWWCTF